MMLALPSSGQQKILLNHRIKENILNASTGIVLVKTSGAVYGIDPEKHTVVWENEAIGKLDFSRYREIPFTPYVFFEDKPLLNSKFLSKTLNAKGVSRVIVDVTKGKIMFNSEDQGFQAVFNTMVLPEQHAVLVDGKIDEGFGIGLFDFETGTSKWMTKVSSDFFSRTKGALLNQEKVLLDADNNIFWLKNRHLLKIDLTTGDIVHNEKGISSILLDEQANRLYLSSNKLRGEKLNQETAIYAVDPKNMESNWARPPARVVGNIIETTLDGNKLVVITSKGFDIIDANKGTKKWKRSDPLPLIRKIVPVGDSYLVVQENQLTRIDAFGHDVWDAPLRITFSNDENPVHIFDNAAHALFITPSRVNRVQIETGKKIWNEDVSLFDADYIRRNLKLKLPYHRVWFNPETDQFPVYNENKFYLFNNRDSVPPQSLHHFDFGRRFPELKIRNEGYFLFEGNNFYLFNFSGNLMYKKEYPAMKSGSFVRRSFRNSIYWLKRSLQVSSATLLFAPTQANRAFRNTIVSNNLGAFGSAAGSIYGTYNSYVDGFRSFTELDIDVDSNLEYVFRRIRKSRKNDDQMIIAVPKDDKIRLINFHIDTGAEETIRELDADQDNFIIDEAERLIYFFENKEVSIQKLN
ncbi:MAG: PQQ-binding-like beta-propeller repeat protein [Flavobacteriaceae bacterium]